MYDERKYDPQAVDIWSLAIIFCCMSLRRFPWKLPRVTDNSYRLFASQPTPGHDPKQLIIPTREKKDASETPAPDSIAGELPKSPQHGIARADSRDPERKEVIRGPWRLLRLLPRECRHIIGRMLTIDPKRRADMSEILDEPWISDTPICRQVGPGLTERPEGHTHILEPPAPTPPK